MATYIVHLRLTGKLVVDFLLVIITLFFARCYGLIEIGVLNRVGQFRPNFNVKGDVSH